MARPQRILYVHHRRELGGAPSSLSYLIEQLDRDRFEPHVYCPGGAAGELFERSGAVLHVGPVASFTHIWASTYQGRRWLLLGRELAQLPLHLVRFRRTLAQGGFALVHLNDSPLLMAAWIARRARVPVVWHLRSALPNAGRDRRSRLIQGAIRRYARASIAINSNVADTFAVGAVVIPNTVDLDRFEPGDGVAEKSRHNLPTDQPVVAYFGFIYPSKGYREFIESAAILQRRGVRATYLMVGGPVRGKEFFRSTFGRVLRFLGLAHDHETEAHDLVARSGLGEDFRFVAFTPDTAALYRASDIVVAPSRGPELGRPVLEASACGRPVVASGSLDGAGLVLPDRTGFLVPRRSPDVLAIALERLLGDAGLRARFGESAREHAVASFDARRNAARVMDVYERALSAA